MVNEKRYQDGDLFVVIDLDLCAASGECVDVCPEAVYKIIDGKVNAKNIGACTECGACDGICPHNAIKEHYAW